MRLCGVLCCRGIVSLPCTAERLLRAFRLRVAPCRLSRVALVPFVLSSTAARSRNAADGCPQQALPGDLRPVPLCLGVIDHPLQNRCQRALQRLLKALAGAGSHHAGQPLGGLLAPRRLRQGIKSPADPRLQRVVGNALAKSLGQGLCHIGHLFRHQRKPRAGKAVKPLLVRVRLRVRPACLLACAAKAAHRHGYQRTAAGNSPKTDVRQQLQAAHRRVHTKAPHCAQAVLGRRRIAFRYRRKLVHLGVHLLRVLPALGNRAGFVAHNGLRFLCQLCVVRSALFGKLLVFGHLPVALGRVCVALHGLGLALACPADHIGRNARKLRGKPRARRRNGVPCPLSHALLFLGWLRNEKGLDRIPRFLFPFPAGFPKALFLRLPLLFQALFLGRLRLLGHLQKRVCRCGHLPNLGAVCFLVPGRRVLLRPVCHDPVRRGQRPVGVPHQRFLLPDHAGELVFPRLQAPVSPQQHFFPGVVVRLQLGIGAFQRLQPNAVVPIAALAPVLPRVLGHLLGKLGDLLSGFFSGVAHLTQQRLLLRQLLTPTAQLFLGLVQALEARAVSPQLLRCPAAHPRVIGVPAQAAPAPPAVAVLRGLFAFLLLLYRFFPAIRIVQEFQPAISVLAVFLGDLRRSLGRPPFQFCVRNSHSFLLLFLALAVLVLPVFFGLFFIVRIMGLPVFCLKGADIARFYAGRNLRIAHTACIGHPYPTVALQFPGG